MKRPEIFRVFWGMKGMGGNPCPGYKKDFE